MQTTSTSINLGRQSAFISGQSCTASAYTESPSKTGMWFPRSAAWMIAFPFLNPSSSRLKVLQTGSYWEICCVHGNTSWILINSAARPLPWRSLYCGLYASRVEFWAAEGLAREMESFSSPSKMSLTSRDPVTNSLNVLISTRQLSEHSMSQIGIHEILARSSLQYNYYILKMLLALTWIDHHGSRCNDSQHHHGHEDQGKSSLHLVHLIFIRVEMLLEDWWHQDRMPTWWARSLFIAFSRCFTVSIAP